MERKVKKETTIVDKCEKIRQATIPPKNQQRVKSYS